MNNFNTKAIQELITALPDAFSSLREFAECSLAMLKEAQADNWDAVIATEEKRRNYLSQIALTLQAAQQTDDIRELLQQVLAIEEHLIDLSESQRQQFQEKTKELGQGRRATETYQQASRI